MRTPTVAWCHLAVATRRDTRREAAPLLPWAWCGVTWAREAPTNKEPRHIGYEYLLHFVRDAASYLQARPKHVGTASVVRGCNPLTRNQAVFWSSSASSWGWRAASW